MTSPYPLQGKTYCIIGGTSGMGLAISKECAALGAHVFATGTSDRSLEEARDELGPDVDLSILDIRDQAQVKAYAGRFATLDALINCAGASFPEQELDPSVMLNAITINLTGVGYICAAMHGPLKAAEGCVVNFGSLTSYLGSKTNPAYSAAKGGIIQLTKSLARMWGPHGIRVNAISPGYVQTKMTAFRWQDAAQNEEIIKRTPLGRWGQVADVVGPTLFLCSDSAGFITGVSIPVDGGFLLT